MGDNIVATVIFMRNASVIIFLLLSPAHAEKYTVIPSDQIYAGKIPYLKFYLELVINGYYTKTVIPIILKENEYFITKNDLEKLGLDYSKFTSESNFNLNEIRYLDINPDSEWLKLDYEKYHFQVEYISQNQQLFLNLKPEWLPQQMLGQSSLVSRVETQSATGLLNNFDAYVNVPHQGKSIFNLYSEQKFFSDWGILKNTGLYRYSDNINDHEQGYIRYDTVWRFDDEDKIYSLELGDIYTVTKNSWASSMRLGGIQLRRNYTIRPDLITYPLPQFHGEVGLPSTVDLFINGTKNSTEQLQPGPFLISNVPFLNGRGEAVIVTTDAVGRQITTTVPFYVTGDLIQKGLLDYAVSVGALRENFGIKSFDYGDVIGVIDGRYGVTNFLTGELNISGNEKIINTGVGVVIKLYNYGVLNTSYTYSQVDEILYESVRAKNLIGHQYSVGYQYNYQNLGFLIAHSKGSENFYSIPSYYSPNYLIDNSVKSTNANFYISGNNTGTFGVGYFDISRSQSDSTKLLSLSWMPPFYKYLFNTTVSLSANFDLNTQIWSGAIQLTMPLGKTPHRINTGYEFTEHSTDTTFLNYNYQMANTGGFGVDLTHKFNDLGKTYNQAQVRYRNNYFDFEAGVSGDKDLDQWYGLSSSMVWMKDHFFMSNRLGESFAVVSTNNIGDIPIHFENNLIGYTNDRGHLIISNVAPYYNAKYSIDPLNLPTNFDTPIVEQRISAKLGSGVIVNFPVKEIKSASVYLKFADGHPVPVGSEVYQQGKPLTYVGMDGIVFISEIEESNVLRVALTDGRVCKAEFNADLNSPEMQFIHNVKCELQGVQP